MEIRVLKWRAGSFTNTRTFADITFAGEYLSFVKCVYVFSSLRFCFHLSLHHTQFRDAALSFLQVCVLKTLDVIDCHQDRPYGDILLSKGPRWERLVLWKPNHGLQAFHPWMHFALYAKHRQSLSRINAQYITTMGGAMIRQQSCERNVCTNKWLGSWDYEYGFTPPAKTTVILQQLPHSLTSHIHGESDWKKVYIFISSGVICNLRVHVVTFYLADCHFALMVTFEFSVSLFNSHHLWLKQTFLCLRFSSYLSFGNDYPARFNQDVGENYPSTFENTLFSKYNILNFSMVETLKRTIDSIYRSSLPPLRPTFLLTAHRRYSMVVWKHRGVKGRNTSPLLMGRGGTPAHRRQSWLLPVWQNQQLWLAPTDLAAWPMVSASPSRSGKRVVGCLDVPISGCGVPLYW